LKLYHAFLGIISAKCSVNINVHLSNVRIYKHKYATYT